jgi:hypothetical protein
LSLGGVDPGKIAAPGFEQRAVKPLVWTPRVGMNAIDDDLLAVAEELDFFARSAGSRDEIDGDFGKGSGCSEGDRTLGPVAEPRDDRAALAEAVARQILDCLRGVGIKDVNVERRREPRQDASVLRRWVRPAPEGDFLAGGFFTLLPRLEGRDFAVDGEGAIAALK